MTVFIKSIKIFILIFNKLQDIFDSRRPTIYKGSENLRALFLGLNSRVAWGFSLNCCGWRALRMLGIPGFQAEKRLFSALFSVWPAGVFQGSCRER